MANHPSREQLSGFVLGKLPPDATDAVAEHIDHCPPCQHTVQNLEGHEDTLLKSLQSPPATAGSDAQVERIIERVAALGPADQPPPESQKTAAPELTAARKEQIFGEYVVIGKIGAGGMGQVFKARHRRMDRVVALKILPKSAMNSTESVKRFQREAKAAARLIHPNIVTAFDAGEHRGMHYLVMEYVDGGDLSNQLKVHGPLPVEKAVDYLVQAARGLAFAHSEGVIHRDIKPANLLVDRKGVLKILDMGLARLDDALTGRVAAQEGLTQSGQVMGTVDYMAPEQAMDTRLADVRSDVYSLGCTLYRLLLGENVYDGETLVQKLLAHREQAIPAITARRPDVPAELDDVFRKMVAKEPEDRYQTMDEVIIALEQVRSALDQLIAAARAVQSASPSSSHVLGRPSTKRRTTAARGGRRKPPMKFVLAGAAGFLFVALGVWIIIYNSKHEEVAKIYVPDGHKVEIVPDGPQSPQPVAAATQPAVDRDRAAAEWFLKQRVDNPALQGLFIKTASGGGGQFWNVADLPKEPFFVTGLGLHYPDFNPPFAVSDDELQNIAGLPELESLTLDCGKLTDRAFDVLATLPKLGNVCVGRAKFSAASWAKLKDTSGIWRVTFADSDLAGQLGGFRGYPYLWHFAFAKGCRMAPADIESLAAIPFAPQLDFFGSVIGDQHVSAFAGFAKSGQKSRVILHDSIVTPAGVERLVATLPGSVIVSPHQVDGAYVHLNALIDPARDVIPIHGPSATNPWVIDREWQQMSFNYVDELSGKLRLPLDVEGREYHMHVYMFQSGKNPQLEFEIPLAAGAKRILFDKLQGWNDLRVRKLGDKMDIGIGHGNGIYETLWRGNPNDPSGLIPYSETRTDPKTIALLADGGVSSLLHLNLKFLDKQSTLVVEGTPANNPSPSPTPGPDRLAAEKMLNLGGVVTVAVGNSRREVRALADLPGGVLELLDIRLQGSHNAQDADLEFLEGLTKLAGLRLSGRVFTDRALNSIGKIPNLENLWLLGPQVTDAGLKRIQFLKKLETLSLDGTQVGDAGLELLKNLPLVTLNLANAPITDAGLAHLKVHDELNYLCVNGTSVGDAGLVHMRSLPKLATLELQNTSVSDAGFEHLTAIKSLTSVDLSGSKVTAVGLAKFRSAQPDCKIEPDLAPPFPPVGLAQSDPERYIAQWVLARGGTVGVHWSGGSVDFRTAPQKLPEGELVVNDIALRDIKGVRPEEWQSLGKLKAVQSLSFVNAEATDDVLRAVAGHWTLKNLIIPGNPGITDAGIEAISGLTELARLDLGATSVSHASMSHVAKFTRLLTLKFSNCPNFKPQSLAPLQPLTRLELLELYNCSINDVLLADLKPLTELYWFIVGGTPITDAGIAHLAAMPALHHLDLSYTTITAAGLRKLASHPGLAYVFVHNCPVAEAELLELAKAMPRIVIVHPRLKGHYAPAHTLEEQFLAAGHGVNQSSHSGFATRESASHGACIELKPPYKSRELLHQMKQLPCVRALSFTGGEGCSPDDLRAAIESLHDRPTLIQFKSNWLPKMDDALCRELVRHPALREYWIWNCLEMTPENLDILLSAPNLQGLMLQVHGATDRVWTRLGQLPYLEWVHLPGTQVTGKGCAALRGATSLHTLGLKNSPTIDAELAGMAEAPMLHHLDLINTPLTDDGLAELEKCRRLRILYAHGTKITAAGVAKFQRALPTCTVFCQELTASPTK